MKKQSTISRRALAALLAALILLSALPALAATYKDSETVSAVQEVLAAEGFYTSKIDGKLGSGTEKAIKKYQKAHGLKQSGKLDDALLEEMGLQPGGAPLTFTLPEDAIVLLLNAYCAPVRIYTGEHFSLDLIGAHQQTGSTKVQLLIAATVDKEYFNGWGHSGYDITVDIASLKVGGKTIKQSYIGGLGGSGGDSYIHLSVEDEALAPIQLSLKLGSGSMYGKAKKFSVTTDKVTIAFDGDYNQQALSAAVSLSRLALSEPVTVYEGNNISMAITSAAISTDRYSEEPVLNIGLRVVNYGQQAITVIGEKTTVNDVPCLNYYSVKVLPDSEDEYYRYMSQNMQIISAGYGENAMTLPTAEEVEQVCFRLCFKESREDIYSGYAPDLFALDVTLTDIFDTSLLPEPIVVSTVLGTALSEPALLAEENGISLRLVRTELDADYLVMVVSAVNPLEEPLYLRGLNVQVDDLSLRAGGMELPSGEMVDALLIYSRQEPLPEAPRQLELTLHVTNDNGDTVYLTQPVIIHLGE